MTNGTDPSNSANSFDKLYKAGMNLGALSANIHYISEEEVGLLWGDKWKEVPCADGSYAQVLKNPLEAWEMYAKEWDASFKVLIDIVEQIKAEADVNIKNKIIALFNGLNHVDNTIRVAYLNAYITFASRPCSDMNQEYKIKMDGKINAAAATLTSFRMLIDIYKDKAQMKENIDFLIQEYMSLIREIAKMLSS